MYVVDGTCGTVEPCPLSISSPGVPLIMCLHTKAKLCFMLCVSVSRYIAPVSIYAHAHYVAMDSSPCVPEKTKLILI